jgi:hypothetical protein
MIDMGRVRLVLMLVSPAGLGYALFARPPARHADINVFVISFGE